jgi:ubiquinone/menaquinone biosynthesis C-methylase UbiE
MIRRILRHLLHARAEAPSELAEPINAQSAPGKYDIALRDLSESGWFNQETGELYPHFAISDRDVVLDVGCGEGGKAAFCARQGAHIIFVDIDEDKVHHAAKLLATEKARQLTPIVGDCNPLPLSDASVSRIIASEVLEHVEEPIRFLDELVRVGSAGSLYLLTVPDPVAENVQRKLAPSVYFEKPNHIRIFERQEFADLVSDSGLKIIHRGASGFYSALWWQFFWTTGVNDLSNPVHPLLDRWSETWRALLDTSDGLKIKAALDQFMPKSQCIVAMKT